MFLRMRSLSKFIDAATVLAVTTAALYFWGYVYYRAFCERLDIRFHGFAIPLQDYLVVGWQGVVAALLSILVLLFISDGLRFAIDWLVDRFVKVKYPSPMPRNHSFRGMGCASYIILVLLLSPHWLRLRSHPSCGE